MSVRNPMILDRFWSKVEESDVTDCWPWRSSADTYPRFRILPGFRAIGGHVFSWILANKRDVPEGLVVMHSCDNKRCVNPTHLSVGTLSDNTKDATRKGLNDPSKAWAARAAAARQRRGN